MDICLEAELVIKVKQHSIVQLDTTLEDRAAGYVRQMALGMGQRHHAQVSCAVHFQHEPVEEQYR